MTDSFYSIIPKQTDSELLEYIANHQQYMKEAVELAISELKKRGKPISDDELSRIRKEISERDSFWEKKEDEDADLFSPKWKKNIVTDSSAPELYSRHTLSSFSFLLFPLFGSILLAVNLKNLGKDKLILPIIAFGVIFTIVSFTLISYSTNLTMLINATGAFLLYSSLWNRYIGNETRYRVKPIWIPLLIGIILNIVPLLHFLKMRIQK